LNDSLSCYVCPVSGDAFASLRIPGVPSYVFGRLIYVLGRKMLTLAIGWQLYERTHSAFALGLVGLVQVVPAVLFALRAGDLADRFDRRKLGALTQVFVGAVGVGLAIVSHLQAPVWIIYVLLFVTGTATAFNAPAVSALLPLLVPKEQLVNVNAWASIGFQLAATVGPVLGGQILSMTHDAVLVYLLVAASSLAFAHILTRLPMPVRDTAKFRAEPRDLKAGLRFVFRTEELLGAITLDLFAVLLGGVTALLPIFAKDILHVGPRGLGFLQAAASVGALATGLVVTHVGSWRRSGHVLLFSVAGYGVATIGFGLSRLVPLSLAFLFLTGVFDALSVVTRRTLEQVLTPDRLRGRVSAIHWVFIGLSNELGEFESGTTAALLGPVGSVLLGSVGTLIVVGVAAKRWPRLRELGPLDEIIPRE
jgi:MFS family permease